jgi:hypothetical protein
MKRPRIGQQRVVPHWAVAYRSSTKASDFAIGCHLRRSRVGVSELPSGAGTASMAVGVSKTSMAAWAVQERQTPPRRRPTWH